MHVALSPRVTAQSAVDQPSCSSPARRITRPAAFGVSDRVHGALCATTLAAMVTLTPVSPAVAAPPPPSYSGVDPTKSSYIQSLVEKSNADKAKNDQERLDNFYKKDFRINRVLGAEVLKEPCDPRDPEYGYKCRPTLPRLPQDRFEGFEDVEKTGFGKVLGMGDVDRAADALVKSEQEKADSETVEETATDDVFMLGTENAEGETNEIPMPESSDETAAGTFATNLEQAP